MLCFSDFWRDLEHTFATESFNELTTFEQIDCSTDIKESDVWLSWSVCVSKFGKFTGE